MGRTSTVTTLTPPGFQRLRFQPSAHIAPRLTKLTVPSPSPSFTPFLTCVLVNFQTFHFSEGTCLGQCFIICDLEVNPVLARQRHIERRSRTRAVWCVVRAYSVSRVGEGFIVFILSPSIPSCLDENSLYTSSKHNSYQYERWPIMTLRGESPGF